MTFTQKLLPLAGATGTPYFHDDLKSFIKEKKFFEPSYSSGHFFRKASTVGTAPVIHSIFTIKFFLKCFLEFIRSILNLVIANLDESKQQMKESGHSLKLCFLALLTTIASPVTNFVDLIGGTVKNMTSKKNDLSSKEEKNRMPEKRRYC